MPSKKAFIITIIIALVIAVAIFKFTQQGSDTNISAQSLTQKFRPTPSPTPKPTLPPITGSTNLTGEMDKLTAPDYDNLFESLHNETSAF